MTHRDKLWVQLWDLAASLRALGIYLCDQATMNHFNYIALHPTIDL